jgi:FkbM family methyltransferase
MNAINRFLDAAENGRLQLFGRTSATRQLSAIVRAGGFREPLVIESSLPCDPHSADYLTINCVVAGRPLAAQAAMQALGLRNTLSYFDLYAADPDQFTLPFCADAQRDYQVNAEHYDWLRNILADQISRETLEQVLQLRIYGHLGGTRLQYRLPDQYWDEIIDLRSRHSFFDGGAFDGQNSTDFMKRQPHWERIWMAEPMPDAALSLRQKFSDANIVVAACALGSTNGITKMQTLGTQSHQSEQGTVVPMRRIDDLIDQHKLGYLKLDIEGAEIDALHGAVRSISRDRPALAICVYHQQSHFWQVPRFVRSIDASYQVALRHYTEGVFETVMYFY